MTDYTLTDEMIRKAKVLHACSEAINWLWEQPRTWQELVEHHSSWATWAIINIPGCPIDLNGLDSYDRSSVMALRSDCPIDLSGLNRYERARARCHRLDCPPEKEN